MNIRFTEQEYETLRREADERGYPGVSSFIRVLLRAQPFFDRHGLDATPKGLDRGTDGV